MNTVEDAKCEDRPQTDEVVSDVNRIARKIRRNRANLGKSASLAHVLHHNPFDPHRPLSLWDFQRLRQGYMPRGRDPQTARLYLQALRLLAKNKGIRPGKFRFKTRNGAPHPDEMKIVLTGKHMPDTILRAARWSAQRHGLRPAEPTTKNHRPKLP